MVDSDRDRQPKGVRGRADREEAFQFWASLPVDRRSYAAVAGEFAVSPRTVERYAREGRWRERLRGIDADAAAQADQQLGRDRARQLADFHQLIEASCVTYARQLASGQVRITAAEFVGLIKVALLLQGAPEARVELVSNSEEWVALRSRILDAVAPFPEARLALADALEPGQGDEDEPTRG
jgi:hypothetical protein